MCLGWVFVSIRKRSLVSGDWEFVRGFGKGLCMI